MGQRDVCTFRLAQKAAYRTAISAAQTCFYDNFGNSGPIFIISLLSNSQRLCGGRRNYTIISPLNLLPVGHLRVLSSIHCQALTLLLNRWLACLTGSSILVLKLTISPDPFPRNLPLSPMDWFHGFYPARVRKSLALKTSVTVRQIKPAQLAFGRTLI